MVFIPRVVVAAGAVAGAAAATLPIARSSEPVVVPLRYQRSPSSKSLAEIAKDRAQAVNDRFSGPTTKRSASSGPATNEVASYIADVSIGGTSYSLIVDSGSSNTWCGAQNACEPSSSGHSTGNSVYVRYGSGSFRGTEYTDKVSFAGLTVTSQSVGAATTSTGFQGVDGIFGLGPVDLTEDTVSNTNTVPTFMDNLYKQGSIPTEVLGVYFQPESGGDDDDTNGELTLGGIDSSRYSGTIDYVPVLTSGAASAYWGIAVNGFTFNGQKLGSSQNAIVDTGTTIIALPDNILNSILSATGGKMNSEGWVVWSVRPTATLTLTLGSTNFNLTPNQYVAPAAQAANFGLPAGKYYGWIGASGYNTGSGQVDTIIGQKFIEQYYTILDTTNKRVGFAAH